MSAKMLEPKEKTSLYFSAALLNRARAITSALGVPMSRICRDGMERELVKYEAMNRLAKTAS